MVLTLVVFRVFLELETHGMLIDGEEGLSFFLPVSTCSDG
jgi:hypothetical protein